MKKNIYFIPFLLPVIIFIFLDTFVNFANSLFNNESLIPTNITDQFNSYEYINLNFDAYDKITRIVQPSFDEIVETSYYLYNKEEKIQNNSEKTLKLPELKEFITEEKKTVQSTKISIQMIIPEDRMAIINNQIFYVGDEFDGRKIISLSQSAVCFKNLNKEKECIKIFQ